MANEFKVRKGLVVNGSGSVILDVQGSQGQLFSVTDQLSGSVFAVKDISGMPVIEAFSDDRVNIGTFGREAIKVTGSLATVSGSFTGSFSGSISGSLFGSLSGSLSGSAFGTFSGSLSGSAFGTFSGSLFGTSSWSVSSSYAVSASIALSASSAPGYTVQFTQSVSAPTWSVTHNMNTRTPVVQVYDTTYSQIIPNQIVATSANALDIRFDYSQSGYAVLSNGGAPYVTGSTSLLIQSTPAVTWSFGHNLNSKYVAFETYDSNDYVIVPSNIKVIDQNNAEIHLSSAITGKAVAQFSGISGQTNAQTASYVNPLSQSVIISGSLNVTGQTTFFAYVSGSQPITNPSSSLVLITGSILPNSSSTSGGSSVLINTLISASANNQTLVGLEILPTYNTGSFTGAAKYGLKVEGIYFGQVTSPSNYNIAIGSNNANSNGFTLQNLSTGVRNIAIGAYAGGQITTGTDNITIGYGTGAQRTYSGNGSANVLIGNSAGLYSTGNNQVAIGYNAGNSIVSDGVILIGANTVNAPGVAASGNNTIIGNSASSNIQGGNQIVLGANAIGSGPNTTVIGNSSTTYATVYGNLILNNSISASTITGSSYKLDATGNARLTGTTGFGTLSTPTGVTATASTSSGFLVDGTYYYKVAATDMLGNTTVASNEVSASISGSNGSGSVSLSWTGVSNSTGYRIYQGTNSGSENKYFTSTNASYVDTGSAGTAGSPPGYNNTVTSYINTSNQLVLGPYASGTSQGGGFSFTPSGNAGGVSFNSQGAYGRIWSNPQGSVQNGSDQPGVGFVAYSAGTTVWYGTISANGGSVRYNASINGANRDHIWYTNFNEQMRLFSSTGNLLIVGAGFSSGSGLTPVDAGFRLDVSGSARIQTSLTVSGSGATITGSLGLTGSLSQTSGYVILPQVSQSLNYADDTAAAAGGVPLGGLYRNGNFVLIRLS